MSSSSNANTGPLSHGVLDIEVERALQTAVSEAGHDPKLAKRLIHWMAEVAQGRASMGSESDTEKYFDAARNVIRKQGEG